VSELITIEEARERVLASVTRLRDEPVALDVALGRVLAEDVTSAIAVPPFDSSGMDGYAVVAGPGGELEVIGEARAGRPWFQSSERPRWRGIA
jgi:molybdopterin molybdotransferase